MSKPKLALLFLFVALIGSFFYFDGARYLSVEYFSTQREAIIAYKEQHLIITSIVFFLIYVAVTALSLPGAAIMTLAAGAIFGLALGMLIVSFASTIGATLAFLASRFLLRDWVQEKFTQQLEPINRGFEEEGNFYLFTLRLVPAFPFFMINLLMGITPIRTWSFFWVSQVGMLAGTAVYVNAGTQLGQVVSLEGILSPTLILSFCLLGIFPLLAKRLIGYLKNRQAAENE